MRILMLMACAALAAPAQPITCRGEFRGSAAWLENFHHAWPVPPPAPALRGDPLAARLDEIHQAAMSLARHARLAENLFAATEALREARASAALTAELRAGHAAPRRGPPGEMK